ncbi:MAG TPA: alpha/beta hydrolase [Acidimicrobiales bacterium]|nr:alpha/beta hydrolase [Acidimicrobiales bacterium]
MKSVVSRDGTPIAFEVVGSGPPLVIVVGAFSDHARGGPLAQSLTSQLTVYTYDRRGRGASGDTRPYAVEREIEDLDAIIAAAGGSAFVFGYSSGAVLAIEAAAAGSRVTKLAVYDVPLKADGPLWNIDRAAELERLVGAGRRGDAVEYFQEQMMGMPAAVVAQLRAGPGRPSLEAMAPSLVYDARLVGDGALPLDAVRALAMPTLALGGLASAPFMAATAEAIGQLAPGGASRLLVGQSHDLDPEVLGPILAEFLLAG